MERDKPSGQRPHSGEKDIPIERNREPSISVANARLKQTPKDVAANEEKITLQKNDTPQKPGIQILTSEPSAAVSTTNHDGNTGQINAKNSQRATAVSAGLPAPRLIEMDISSPTERKKARQAAHLSREVEEDLQEREMIRSPVSDSILGNSVTQNLLQGEDGEVIPDSPGSDPPIHSVSNESGQSDVGVLLREDPLQSFDGLIHAGNTCAAEDAKGTLTSQQEAVSECSGSHRHEALSGKDVLNESGQHQLEDDFQNAKPAAR